MTLRTGILLLLCSLLTFARLQADNGYEIRVKLANYTENKLKLGFHYGNKQYIRDSSVVNKDGYFVFSGKEELAPGIYLIIMQPNSTYFEMMVVRGQEHFTISTDINNIVKGLKTKNSPENELYYEYLNTIAEKKEKSAKIKQEMKADSANLTKYRDKLKILDNEVEEYQNKLINKHPNSFTAQIIKSSRDIVVPKFEGSEEEVRNKRYFYYKEHFFDNFNMSDEKMIRTPLLFNRVDYYVNKLVIQEPDSLIEAVDRVLKLTRPVDDAFKFFCTHFLNYYAKAEYIGQDAVYVYLALNYYNKPGMTPWVDKAQIDKIVENARNIEPTLLGKTAMNFELQTKDNRKVSLYDIKSEYTVLVFWAPDCGHCQKEMPYVINFWEKWRLKGVELISICNRYTPEKVGECWKFVEERPGMKFTTGVDMYMRSNTQANYWVKSTPMIYILDKDKKIVMKKIQAEKLEEIMNEIIEVEAARKLEQSKGK